MTKMRLGHSPVIALAEWILCRLMPLIAPWVILAGIGLIVVCLVTIWQR